MSEWKIATPINKFEHPDSGSQIDIVSVVHVGTPDYYRKLGNYIMERQANGFTVHYETISSDEEITQPTNPIESLKTRVQEARTDVSADNLILVEDHSNYTTQCDSDMFNISDAKNYDIAEADYVRRSGLLKLTRNWISARRLNRKLERAADKGSDAMDELIFGLLKKDIDEIASGTLRNKRRDRVTIHARNQIALEGIDTALSDNPSAKLLLVWGIGHLAGLKSGLTDRGYARTGHEEVDVAVNYAQLRRNMQTNELELQRP
jgi:hypothetical protein